MQFFKCTGPQGAEEKSKPQINIYSKFIFQSFRMKFYVPFATLLNDISVNLQEKIIIFKHFAATYKRICIFYTFPYRSKFIFFNFN